jgi:hypothetical protein
MYENFPYKAFQTWVALRHPKLLAKTERNTCVCWKRKSLSYVEGHYPECMELCFRTMAIGTNRRIVSVYFQKMVDEIIREFPEIAMEYYMVGDE